MLRVHLAELRDSWTAWLGVTITFVMVNAMLVIPSVIGYSGYQATRRGQLDFQQSAPYTIVQALMIAFICFVAIPVIGSATGLVVDSRRGSLARLGLAGATPQQVRGTLGSQLVAVVLACAAVGDLVGLALVRPYLNLCYYAQRHESSWVPIEISWSLGPVLAANLLCVVVALLGGRRHAGRASQIPPVEALRQASAPLPRQGLGRGGWAKAVFLLLLIVGSYAAVPALLAHRNKETISNLLILGAFQIFFWGALLSVVGSLIAPPLTRFWTGLVPTTSPSWMLARATVTARPERMQRSLTPAMFCVGLAVGEVGIGDSMIATFNASGFEAQLTTGDLASFVQLLGPSLAIAFAGGIGTLIMMSRQRDAELALAGIAGATPRQRVWIPTLEAVIITVSAVLLASGMVIPAYVFQAYALSAAGMTWAMAFPWLTTFATVGVSALVTVGYTVLPTLRARLLPENRVIARLVAE